MEIWSGNSYKQPSLVCISGLPVLFVILITCAYTVIVEREKRPQGSEIWGHFLLPLESSVFKKNVIAVASWH